MAIVLAAFHAINDITERALDSAGFHSVLDPVALDRGDGKLPDGLKVFPYAAGELLVWDATCADTFASWNLNNSADDSSHAAWATEERKCEEKNKQKSQGTTWVLTYQIETSISRKPVMLRQPNLAHTLTT